MYDYQLDPAFIEGKLIDLEDRSRGNNLRAGSIKERTNETWEECENELHTLFKDSRGIKEEVVIERAHRMKRDTSNKEKVKTLMNAKKLKGKNIFINEDL